MDKPKKHIREALHWNECVDYIENKYKINIRDYAGKFKNRTAGDTSYEERPYQDFWHWVISINEHIINGCYFSLTEEDLTLKDLEDWQKHILTLFLDEFAEPCEWSGRTAEFWVDW